MEQSEPFYHGLKQLRVAQGITLEDISAHTRINTRFLEALEQGDFNILPKTYIRLFLRSYCQEIGSDFIEVVKQLEDFMGEPAEEPFPAQEELSAAAVTAIPAGGPDLGTRPPARLRQDFITGAAIFLFLVLIISFARRVYQEPVAAEPPTTVSVADNTPIGQPGGETPARSPETPPAASRPAAVSRRVVPVESSIELPESLFAEDRIVENLQERVRLTPPVRLTLMARDNVVIQPVSAGQTGTAFNLTVAQARQWTIQEELILRTSHINLLRGDLNGVPINFGEATGVGTLRITPTGVYEVSAYLPQSALERSSRSVSVP